MIVVEVIFSLSMGNASITCYLIFHINKCCIFHWFMAGQFTIKFYYVTFCYNQYNIVPAENVHFMHVNLQESYHDTRKITSYNNGHLQQRCRKSFEYFVFITLCTYGRYPKLDIISITFEIILY